MEACVLTFPQPYAADPRRHQPIPVESESRGQHSFDVIASAVGCSTASDKITCLRAVAYDDLVDATNLLPGVGAFAA